MPATKRLYAQTGGKRDAAHAWPRISEPSRRCAGVSLGRALSAFQKESCSSGVMAIT